MEKLAVKKSQTKIVLMFVVLLLVAVLSSCFGSVLVMDSNAGPQPILLLKGSRWSVEGKFDAFHQEIVVDQSPGDPCIEQHEHEAKTGLTIWDAVRTCGVVIPSIGRSL